MCEELSDEELEITCGMCESTDTTESMKDYTFPYGVAGPDQVELTVNIPVRTCNNKECGFEWYNWKAELIMDAYVEQWKQEQQQKNK